MTDIESTLCGSQADVDAGRSLVTADEFRQTCQKLFATTEGQKLLKLWAMARHPMTPVQGASEWERGFDDGIRSFIALHCRCAATSPGGLPMYL
jgi:hypothetical protein